MKTTRDLKEMMEAPADKSFFKKYGLPKSAAARKSADQKAGSVDAREYAGIRKKASAMTGALRSAMKD